MFFFFFFCPVLSISFFYPLFLSPRLYRFHSLSSHFAFRYVVLSRVLVAIDGVWIGE
jgi:hypothetical protein